MILIKKYNVVTIVLGIMVAIIILIKIVPQKESEIKLGIVKKGLYFYIKQRIS